MVALKILVFGGVVCSSANTGAQPTYALVNFPTIPFLGHLPAQMTPALIAASKTAALLVLVLCVMLPIVARAQDEDQWFWIMADSENSTATCPGRCLAVNDSGAGDYNDKPVVFVACKTDSATGSTTTTDNKNQRWLRGDEFNTTIRFNASAALDDPQAGILCLQPDPATSNRALKISKCTGRQNQQWIVADNSIATLAFNPRHYLAMGYGLAGFLNENDGLVGWRQATILPSSRSLNKSFTATFSMVDASQEIPPPQPAPSNESQNFIRNGGFEQSSYDFPNATATLPVNPSDPFSLCDWQVMKDSATLSPNSTLTESNRSLLIKDGVVRQIVATSPGAFYVLVLKVAIAPPDPSDTSSQCSDNDTLSVNPYPSTNLHQDVEVRNQTWTTQHIAFQAGGGTMQLAFQGCATCGCYLGDLNLMQVLPSAPFPPPPPRPSPPPRPVLENRPTGGDPKVIDPRKPDLFPDSNKLSNGAVVGIVVGTAAMFFGIGWACLWVLIGNKKESNKENEISMGRPGEWSIQTTTPAQSQAGGRGNSSTTVTTPRSAVVVSASSLQTATTTPPLSSSNPHAERSV